MAQWAETEGERLIELYRQPREVLSLRERQLVALLEQGVCRTKIMAAMMGITEGSLRIKLSGIYRKLRGAGYDVDSLSSLAVWCFRPDVMQREKAA